MSETQSRKVPVFIVGGGPVGLAMALLLERFGIGFVVVERSSGTTNHPKARGCWSRTMELFRQWGIEDAVRDRGLARDADVFAFVETIAGREFGRTSPERDLDQSPSWKSIVSQDVVEEELLKVVQRARHGKVLYGTRFVDFIDNGEGVTVRTCRTDSDALETWSARYLIGADGAGSPVRRQAGIEMRGPATLAVVANDYWRADLSRIPGSRHVAAYRTFPKNGEELGSVLNTNANDRWLSVIRVGIAEDERERPWTDEDVRENARTQVGIPDLSVEVISRSIWRMSRQVAGSFRMGNVFLVGDAAHRFPPNGGFGMNSGIQDAHNLAWKLHFVLSGLANESLLDTYDLERRPVAESNADFSYGNSTRYQPAAAAIKAGNMDRINFWIKDTENHLHSTGQSLGFSYDHGALVPDGTVKAVMRPRFYEPSDRPGGRFPHLWLDLTRKRTTLDWFDRSFVLVCGPLADEWRACVESVATKLGVPLHARTLESAREDLGIAMGSRGAVLVRPDGHVAFRMPWTPSDPASELATALQKILGREAALPR